MKRPPKKAPHMPSSPPSAYRPAPCLRTASRKSSSPASPATPCASEGLQNECLRASSASEPPDADVLESPRHTRSSRSHRRGCRPHRTTCTPCRRSSQGLRPVDPAHHTHQVAPSKKSHVSTSKLACTPLNLTEIAPWKPSQGNTKALFRDEQGLEDLEIRRFW